MTKLTPSHLAILASACGRDDGLAVRPDTLKPAAAAKAAAKLIELEVVREVRAKGDMPVWRGDEQGRAYSLKILKAGRAAVQSAGPSADAVSTKICSAPSISLLPASETQLKIAKAGSKRAVIIALLDRKDGVTIDDLMAATGWLPHTTRAALSGLRKSGLAIVRTRAPGADASVYRIEAGRGAELAA
jgi:hypothetical protein